ncbi:hypothetical protein AX17_003025 [Amanita inopinata Kibby_2008]|nr:hypothetical protein AX17_003025 [Amanita inopinata Kibby_2008]
MANMRLDAMSVFRKILTRKTKAVVLQTPKPAVNAPSHPPTLGSDWLGDIIKIARITAAASELSPFPFIKGAVNIFIALLEPLQQMQKNKNDYRDLAEEVCKLIVMLRDRALQHTSTVISSPEFTQLCADFVQCMMDIQSEMNEVMRQQSVRMRGYFKASVVQDLIARYKARMESLRLNFMALNIFDIRVQLSDIRLLLDTNDNGHVVKEQQVVLPSMPVPVDLDMTDYKQIAMGDIQVLTEPFIRHRGAKNEDVIYTEDSIACIGSSSKTLRIYRGQDPLQILLNDFKIKSDLRHPYIVQLFGVCKSRRTPGLIFHGELSSCSEYIQGLSHLQAIAFSFRMYRQWQAACQYLSNYKSLGGRFAKEINNVCLEGRFDDCHWYTYLNRSKDLQISVEHPVPRQDNVIAKTYKYSYVPPIPAAHMAMIETVLTDGILPTGFDKKTCLLALYKSMLADAEWTYQLEGLTSSAASWPHHAFIIPLGNLRGGRLTFGDNHPFHWSLTRWDDSYHECAPYKKGDWSRFTILSTTSAEVPYAHRYAWAKFPFNEITDRCMWTWLAQAESLRRQIKQHECTVDDNILIGRQIEYELGFQTAFTKCSYRSELEVVYLFIKNIGSNGLIESYWSTDPEGSQVMTLTETSLLGLQKPSLSMELHAAHWSAGYYEALRLFHRTCGFDPDSNDIAHFLRLPIASFESKDRGLKKCRSRNALQQGNTQERVGRNVKWENGTFVWSPRRSSFSSRYDVRVQPWQWYNKLWDSPQCWLD